jgi:hypothetical protein
MMKYRFLFFMLMAGFSGSVLSQNVAMPTPFPALSPVRGANLNRGTLTGMGVQYNDGSYINEKGNDIKGTPLLFGNWNYGTVWLVTGEKYDSMRVKYDLYSDKLIVLINDTEYEFNTGVSSFRITDSVSRKVLLFRNGFDPASSFSRQSFYQVLYDGETKLLLKVRKQIVSEITSTPGVKTRGFEDERSYFLVMPKGELKKIKKKNTDIIDMLDGNREELKKMINEQKLKLTKDEEIIQLLHYYDSLK